jgi:hypothetical protein
VKTRYSMLLILLPTYHRALEAFPVGLPDTAASNTDKRNRLIPYTSFSCRSLVNDNMGYGSYEKSVICCKEYRFPIEK